MLFTQLTRSIFKSFRLLTGLTLVAMILGSLLKNAVADENEKEDGEILRAHLLQSYPSLAYVESYRQAFPKEIQGDAWWSASLPAPKLDTSADLMKALVALQDQHVSLAAKGGRSESLGILFRTSTDGSMVIWRVFDPAVKGVLRGDAILAINGTPVLEWLKAASEKTFGGNRRSRVAEAALELGVAGHTAHQTAGLGASVTIQLQTGTDSPREVALPYLPMTEERAAAMSAAINQPDLPESFEMDGLRLGTLRLGSFAPQYDAAFRKASDDTALLPGATDDQAMVAGLCAVVHAFIAHADAIAENSDILLLDLRGNFGGFDREARLLAAALSSSALPKSYDIFATGKKGLLRLKPEVEDPSCGHLKAGKPILILTDAGTRSAGEFMAAWMWGAGATVIGERTIGAGGGYEFGSHGFILPHSGTTVKMSEHFTVFDGGQTLQETEIPEQKLIDLVSQDSFAPDRNRPFAIQAAGLKPDLAILSTMDDLRDGGLGQLKRTIAKLKQRKLLP